MDLTSVHEISPLLERHGFRFSKSLGQNFLINAAVPARIAQCSGIGAESCVIEIGPGIGCLTRELAARAKKVVAVEIDARLLPVLSETLADLPNVKIVNADVMKLDLRALIEREALQNVSVCANLPYYITTPVIMKLLEEKPGLESITVMVQKEVAKRFLAKPASRDYGAITPVLQYYTKISPLFDVSAGNFLPRPNVDSAVIKMDLIPPPVPVKDEKMLFRTVKAAFAMRRKTLANNLQKEFCLTREQAVQAIQNAGFPPAVRGERLSLADFALLSGIILTERYDGI